MSEPEGRPPRPQYGEYATPEEQRRRIQQPDATWALETGQAVEAPDTTTPQTLPHAVPVSAAAPASDAAKAPPSPGRRLADRIVTFALLGYGLFTVVTSIPSMLDYASYVNTLITLWGTDVEFTGGAAGNAWGATAAVVLGAGWIATAWLSWRNLAKGRVTWWIPLVGGVVFTVIASVLLVVPLMSDPGIRAGFMGLV